MHLKRMHFQNQGNKEGRIRILNVERSLGCASQTGDLVFAGVFVKLPWKPGSRLSVSNYLGAGAASEGGGGGGERAR